MYSWMQLWILPVVVQLLCGGGCVSAQQLTGPVQTNNGDVQGRLLDFAGEMYSEFLGIPFAKPPVEALRFQPPQPVDSWNGTLNATEFGPICPQDLTYLEIDANETDPRSEDCLYLNIYVGGDVTARTGNDTLLPVMLFIHGGSLIWGDARPYNGAALVTQTAHPVILVTIQYRLGMLGFFSSGDSNVPGNAGLRDQLMAMQWTRDNIQAFGGDPSRITIFGESAGAQSVMMQLVSPLSAGVFQRAIVQSTPISKRFSVLSAYRGHYINMARSEPFNCTVDDDDVTGLLSCLQNQPWESLIADRTFSIVIDGDFLREQPRESFINGRYHRDVDVIIGFTNDDGVVSNVVELLTFAAGGVDPFINGVASREGTEFVLEMGLGFTIQHEGLQDNATPLIANTATRAGQRPLNRDVIIPLIRAQSSSAADPITNARLLLDGARDSLFVAFSLWAGQHMAMHGSRVHVYSFNHRSVMLGTQPPGTVQLGAPHASELTYTFGAPLEAFTGASVYTIQEALLAQSMMHTWTTFAANGQYEYLAADSTTHSCEPAYNSTGSTSSYEYIEFDVIMSDASVGDLRHYYQPRADFWNAIDELCVFPSSDDDDMTTSMPHGQDHTDTDSSSSSSEEFDTDILGMEEFQADLIVILFAVAAFLLLVTSIGLGCYVLRKPGSNGSKYPI